MAQDPRGAIARLAVAVMTADGRITPAEREALRRLDELGLGPLGDLAEAEIERAMYQPVDIRAACEELAAVGPQGAAVILSALADVAMSDRQLADAEAETLGRVGTYLGLSREDLVEILDLAAKDVSRAQPVATPADGSARVVRPGGGDVGVGRGTAPEPAASPVSRELAQAYRVLGLPPGSALGNVEAAYLSMVDRYNPAKVSSLGADFAVLAVRKLVQTTAAFETIRAAVDGGRA